MIAETIALRTIVETHVGHGARVHLAPPSSAAAVRLVQEAKARGAALTCDVGVHHLHLCDRDIGDFDANCHLTPPLRGSVATAIRCARALADGTIDAVCSDHTPVDDDAEAGALRRGGAGRHRRSNSSLPLTLQWGSEAGLKPVEALGRRHPPRGADPGRARGNARGRAPPPTSASSIRRVRGSCSRRHSRARARTRRSRDSSSPAASCAPWSAGAPSTSPEVRPMQNPSARFLRRCRALPPFAPSTSRPRSRHCIAEGSATIERLAAADRAPTWENFVEPLDDANERSRAWSQVSHLNAVVNSPPSRAMPTTRRCRRSRSSSREQGQDQRLHAGFKAMRRSDRHSRISARAQALRREPAARFPPRRRGAAAAAEGALPAGPGRARRKLCLALPGQRARRDQRLRPLRHRRARASGTPAGRAATRRARLRRRMAARAGSSRCTMPCYMPVLQYADHHGLRERMYRALHDARLGVRRARNGTTARSSTRILELRAEVAKLLGYDVVRRTCRSRRKMAATPARGARLPRGPRARARSLSPSATCASCANSRARELNLADVRACDVPT